MGGGGTFQIKIMKIYRLQFFVCLPRTVLEKIDKFDVNFTQIVGCFQPIGTKIILDRQLVVLHFLEIR
jgi:hypothetical protein